MNINGNSFFLNLWPLHKTRAMTSYRCRSARTTRARRRTTSVLSRVRKYQNKYPSGRDKARKYTRVRSKGEIALVLGKCQRSNYWHKSKPEDHKISIIILFLQLGQNWVPKIWKYISLDFKGFRDNIGKYGPHMDMEGHNEPFLKILQNMAHIGKNYKFWFNSFWQFVSCYKIYLSCWNMDSCLFIYWFHTDGIIDSISRCYQIIWE